MALPKLNDSPKYTLKIPSSQKSVRFRPYLVKEEKVLMMAAGTKDTSATMGAIADTIEACCEGSIDRDSLTTFDIEYMFTKIRAKSSGETAKILMACSDCETNNEISIDLDKLDVKMPKVKNIAKLTKDISVELRYPPFVNLLEYDFQNINSTETGFSLAAECIKAIHHNEERIDVNEVSKKEVVDFLEQMTSEQFKIIMEFMETMPKLEHTAKFKCSACEKPNSQKIEGLNSFF